MRTKRIAGLVCSFAFSFCSQPGRVNLCPTKIVLAYSGGLDTSVLLANNG